jgi:hypothetical protein
MTGHQPPSISKIQVTVSRQTAFVFCVLAFIFKDYAMANRSIINLDPGQPDFVRYALGRSNWSLQWIPDLVNPGGTIRLAENQIIDIIILGDGYKDQIEFEVQLRDWLDDFYAVDVYDEFRGVFRIHALYTPSEKYCSSSRESFYKIPIDEGKVSRDGWWKNKGDDNILFRQRVFYAVDRFDFINLVSYPRELDVDGDDKVIHNDLAMLYSNLVVLMLVRTRSTPNAWGMTRTVPRENSDLWVNVGFGSHSLHEFGHAFSYLEDEYIQRRRPANKSNPKNRSLFTLSNLTFCDKLEDALWLHISPWGDLRRQAAEINPPLLWDGYGEGERTTRRYGTLSTSA